MEEIHKQLHFHGDIEDILCYEKLLCRVEKDCPEDWRNQGTYKFLCVKGNLFVDA